MPLTPEDVSNKRFTAVRLREGYDMGEVDQFLDEVEAELARLHAENDELRSKVEAAQKGESVEAPPRPEPEAKPEPEPEKEPEPEAEKESEPEAEKEPEPEAEKEPEPEAEKPAAKQPEPAKPEVAEDENVVAEFENIRVSTTAEASRAATRLLEMAGSNADVLVSEAQEEADKILREARSEAESLESETEEQRKHLMRDLEQEKAELNREVGQLREFEKSYRQELRDYFAKQLDALQGDGSASDGTSPGAGEPGAAQQPDQRSDQESGEPAGSSQS